MLWFPGDSRAHVAETVRFGLSYGLVSTASGPTRIWFGDDVIFGADNLATIVPGPSHAASEVEYARRAAQ